jgi:hypothetical protein
MRRLRHLLALLILAAAITIAVAWLAAVFAPIRANPRAWCFSERGIDWTIHVSSGPGALIWESQASRAAGVLPAVSSDELHDADFFGQLTSRSDDLIAHPATAPSAWTDSAFGFPLPALRHSRERPALRFVRGPIALPPGAPAPAAPQVRGGFSITPSITLPYLPLWIGLFADTAFFTLLVAVLHTASRRLMRTRRADQGRCTDCGYDRAALPFKSPCPECGHTRP